VALSRFTFEMGDPGHLEHVIKAVRKIDGVFDVYRITGGKTTGRTTDVASDGTKNGATDKTASD
jgi:GTP pyrophosphokinase